MIHTILFLSVFITFNLWLSTNAGKWGGKPWGSLSAIAFLCYLFGFLFGSYGFWQVLIDLILLVASSFFINIFTGRYAIAFPLIAILAASYYYVEQIYRIEPFDKFVMQRRNIDENHEHKDVILPTDLATDGEIFIVLKPDYNISSLAVTLNRFDIKSMPQRSFEMLRGDWTDLDDVYTLDLPNDKIRMIPNLITALEHHAAVKAVEVNENINLNPIESYDSTEVSTNEDKSKCNDPEIKKQWAYDALNFDDYYKYVQQERIKAKKKIRLAIIDTGIDGEHEDLKDYISAEQDSSAAIDVMGHGTHCAGIAAAITNNKKGIASLIPSENVVEIVSLRVFDENGRTSQQQIVAAMLKAVDMNCQVISMSLGGPINTETQYIYGQAIEYAKKKGAIIIVAAGNENMDAGQRSPAGLNGVITVTAVDQNLKKAAFSNHTKNIKMPIAAPGVDIYSTLPNNTYKKMSGTSMATPYVASLIVVLKSLKPKLSTEEAYEILAKTAIQTAEIIEIGGIIQPKRALKYALTGSLAIDNNN